MTKTEERRKYLVDVHNLIEVEARTPEEAKNLVNGVLHAHLEYWSQTSSGKEEDDDNGILYQVLETQAGDVWEKDDPTRP